MTLRTLAVDRITVGSQGIVTGEEDDPTEASGTQRIEENRSVEIDSVGGWIVRSNVVDSDR